MMITGPLAALISIFITVYIYYGRIIAEYSKHIDLT